MTTSRHTTRRSWRRGLAAALIALVTGLTACSDLPATSPVERGLPLQSHTAQVQVKVGEKAREGMDPDQLVRGFLTANAGFQDSQTEVTSYLAGGALDNWTPKTRILVHSGPAEWTIERPDESSISVSFQAQGYLDEMGYYHQLPPDQRVSANFGLDKVEGNWRIVSMPRDYGLWLSGDEFNSSFQAVRLYYPSAADPTMLVPDVRWFAKGSGLATAVVKAQMEPPPDYLRGSVGAAVPSGTRLTVESVPVENGQATVDLTASVLAANQSERAQIWAQMAAVLTQVPGVDRVRLSSGGVLLDTPPTQPEHLADPIMLGFRMRPAAAGFGLLRRGAELNPVQVVDADLPFFPLTAPTLPTSIDPRWQKLGASPSGATLAAVNPANNSVLVVREGKPEIVPKVATQMTKPAIDRLGYIWVAGVNAGAQGKGPTWNVLASGSADSGKGLAFHKVPAPWLGRRQITHLRLSPDGQRAVVVLRDPRVGADVIGISGVVRANDGSPRSLSEPMLLAESRIASVSDVVWADQVNLAVLGRGDPKAGPHLVWVVSLAGTAATRTTASEPASTIVSLAVSPGGGEGELILRTSGSRFLTRVGSGWHTTTQVGTDLVVPGS